MSGASLDGDRYDVRVWKDGVEHRFRLFRPQELGPQPQKNVMAAALAAPGMKTFRDSTIERYREAQLRTRIERLYGDWSGTDLQVRQDAERALVEIGKVGIAAFKELLAAEKSKDLKVRGEALIERIERSGR